MKQGVPITLLSNCPVQLEILLSTCEFIFVSFFLSFFRFPESEFPVLALMGAPGAFPVHSQNRWLQKFVQWSTKVENTAQEFISTVLNNEPFVGIHLRNGIDFVSETRQ